VEDLRMTVLVDRGRSRVTGVPDEDDQEGHHEDHDRDDGSPQEAHPRTMRGRQPDHAASVAT
jgi:hypothetical protein